MLRKSVYWPEAKVAEYHEEEDAGEPQPGYVLISNHYSLVSQSSEFQWLESDISHVVIGTTFPFIPGYSSAGYVLKVGKGVKDFKVGDKVIGAPVYGAHSNLTYVKAEDVYHVSDNVKLDDAVFYNLGMTAIYSIHMSHLQLGQSLAIIGYGVVGKISLQVAHENGAHPILVLDHDPKRLQNALQNGADYALNPDDTEGIKKALSHFDDNGVDVALDVSGSNQGINQCLDLAKPFGQVIWCTATNKPQEIDYGKLFIKCLTVKGDFVNTNMALQRKSIKEFLWLLSAKRISLPDHSDTIYEPTDENIKMIYDHVLKHEKLQNPLFKWRSDDEK